MQRGVARMVMTARRYLSSMLESSAAGLFFREVEPPEAQGALAVFAAAGLDRLSVPLLLTALHEW